MKRISIIFLQVAVVLIGISTFILMLWEPHIEGRNLHATFLDIYFKDPFLIYAYIGSVSFFVGLYQLFKLLGYIRRKHTFSPNSLIALHTLKYCAIVLVIFALGACAYFFVVQSSNGEDIAGGIAIGLFIIFISAITAILANLFEKRLRNAITIKSDRNLST